MHPFCSDGRQQSDAGSEHLSGAGWEVHIVWTTGWWDKGIGIAHSADLLNGSEQTFLPVMTHEPDAKNCWAPEIFYDDATNKFLIFWATTIDVRIHDQALSQEEIQNIMN